MIIYRYVKRFFDILISLTFLIVLSPLFIIIIMILKFSGEGEVFYRQKRVGLNAQLFDVYKFVTMRKNSEARGSITYQDDPRILPFGKFLRDTKINELLQLLNVLKGDMSVVGPRPLVNEQGFQYYSEEIKSLIYKNNKPGLTGMGSLFFRSEEAILVKLGKDIKQGYREDIMPIKGRLELWYREHKNVWVDIKIIFLTAISILFPNNKLHLKAFPSISPTMIEAYKRIKY